MNDLIIEQIFHCMNSCEARITNGADIEKSFVFLHEETERALNGEQVYPDTK